MAKKTFDPANFLLQQQTTLRQSEVESQQPPPKNPQNLRNPRQVTIHLPASWRHTSCSSSISLSSPHSSKRKTTHDVLLTPRYITNYWRCPVSSLDKNGIDSEIYLQGPCVRGVPLPLAVWWLWNWWSSSASSPGQPRPGREYF